jgi:hydrogenase small subunit
MPRARNSGSGRDERIGDHLKRCGVKRRDFVEFCARLMVAAPFGLEVTAQMTPRAVAAEVASVRRIPIIWLHFQDCTGCSETLLRTSHPGLDDLILHVISLEYHETLMAGSGQQAEEALHSAVRDNRGKFVCVVEGSIPEQLGGIYMQLGSRPAVDVLKEVGEMAAAIVAIGSCAAWGGIPSADPNPTGATGVDSILPKKTIVNIPGCPPNPYTLLGVVLEFAKTGKLPELDDERRPKFAFDRVIHDHCPRRPHFDNGRFAHAFGDAGHREGWCLYHLGCKGPDTHAGCSTRHFNEIPDVWPIGIGAPCVGCTEKHIAFKTPLFQVIPIHNATPPATYPPVTAQQGAMNPLATGLVGLVAGGLIGAGYVGAKGFSGLPRDNRPPEVQEPQAPPDSAGKGPGE